MHKPDFIPNLINAEPPAILGLSIPEFIKYISKFVGSSVGSFEVIGMVIYPSPVVFMVCLVLGLAVGYYLTSRKARSVLEESRGKDPFFSQHKAMIEQENFFRSLENSGINIRIGKKKDKHSFFVRDGYWSQR